MTNRVAELNEKINDLDDKLFGEGIHFADRCAHPEMAAMVAERDKLKEENRIRVLFRLTQDNTLLCDLVTMWFNLDDAFARDEELYLPKWELEEEYNRLRLRIRDI